MTVAFGPMVADPALVALALGLVLLNAFFVAAEFALVKVRSTRMEELARQGSRRAQVAKGAIERIDGYLSATQLGITLASLGLGWLGEPAFARLIRPVLVRLAVGSEAVVHSLALTLAFALITFLHIVLGELAPKSLAIQRTERVALWVALPLRAFYVVFYPALWLLNACSRAALRLVGIAPLESEEAVRSEGELRLILSESCRVGVLSGSKRELLEKAIDYSRRTARHVMVPRADIVYLALERSLADNLELTRQSRHTRYPLCQRDVDHVLGMIHIKDLFHHHGELRSSEDLLRLRRDILFVPESRPLDLLQRDFQQRRTHMAIVVDEYGGTSGLVTLEDVIEELVGEIQDEFDREPPQMQETDEGFVIDGLMHVEEAADQLGVHLEPTEASTVGGYVTTKLGRMARVGDTVSLDSYDIRVLEMRGRRVTKLLACRRAAPPEAGG